jgi:hypothetical protein
MNLRTSQSHQLQNLRTSPNNLRRLNRKKIVKKPPRNSAGFCGGGQVLSWAVEPRKEKNNKKK